MPSVTPYVLQSPRARRNPDLGALTTLVPGSVVDAALAEHNVVTQRLRRLPMRLLVYFLLVMALFPSLSYRELQARMEGGWELLNPGPWQWLTSSAISHARARLPWQVMATLFESLAAPGLKTDGGHWRNYRLVALDGSSMEMATSVGNEATFGGPTGKEGCRVGDPQLRILALVDCWTRAVVGSVVAEFGRGEARLAVEVMSKILPGMLILADRGFVGIELLHLICQARGHVLWRVKTGVARRTSTSKALPDASYLTKMRTRHHHGRGWITGKRPQPITVRVIEFWLNGQLHRLMTTLLDPVEALHPALGDRDLLPGVQGRRAWPASGSPFPNPRGGAPGDLGHLHRPPLDPDPGLLGRRSQPPRR
jgi:hypothetical protein